MLVQRMAAGDEAALAGLYDRYAERVHSLVLHLLRDPDEAEEVVEDAFWQVWRTASRYEPGRGSVGTWLLLIARSRALDRIRARQRSSVRVVRGGESLGEAVDERTAEASPLDRAAEVERRRTVADALAELSPEQRRVIELAFFGGMSQSEIAEHTGEPLGTVKTRVRLAMQRLRKQLAALREGER